jgi:hypothetical protein
MGHFVHLFTNTCTIFLSKEYLRVVLFSREFHRLDSYLIFVPSELGHELDGCSDSLLLSWLTTSMERIRETQMGLRELVADNSL